MTADINGLTNPFENSILNSNLTQLEKDKQIADYFVALSNGYEPPAEVLAEIAALLEAGVLSPEALERMQTLTDQIMAEIGPTITSNLGGDTASIIIDENTSVVTTVTALDRYSLNDGTETLSYSIVGGIDAALFEIDEMTGELRFILPPDYESPGGNDNNYDVIVQVNDGAVLMDTQEIAVMVRDVDEATPGVTMEFGNFYAYSDSKTVSGSAGDDTISFGNFAATNLGTLSVDGGAGDDTISFGCNAGDYYGNISVDGGAGDDTISFGSSAAAISGHVSVDGGAGSDTISFGNEAGKIEGQITVDLGFDDGAADELIFTGAVFRTTIQNWTAGEDALVDVVDPTLWTGVDNGTDTVFTAKSQSLTFEGVFDLVNPQSLTFEGVSGLGVEVSDFLF
jgi:hypothetical protein